MCETFAISVASNLVLKPLEHLFASIGRQFGYVLCYKKCVEDLKNRVKELETARGGVQSSVDEAVYNGKLILERVENWLKSVEEETKKADNLLKRTASAKSACFHGWLPNPVVRHPIGREVKKITQVIQELHEKSRNNVFQQVYRENPPIGHVTATPSAARSVDNKEDVQESKEDVLESRAKITEEVMKALADDKVSVIGVWGAAGVGKSKLLDDIKKRIKIDQKPFDWVAMTKVSRNQDIKTILDEITDALGLHQINEKTPLARAERLRERLENSPQKNVLIIIDNLWAKLDLEHVGIPFGDNNKVRGCKLLISSRYRNVLRDEMDCDQLFPLKELDHDEARILFERTIGNKVNNLEFKTMVDEVVKNCGGLPLLIVPLAKRLKHKGLAAWRNASTNKNLSDVKSLVELSYQDLKDERIRLLFLVCALASGRISMRDSLLYSMGMGLLKKSSETIEKARDMLTEDLQTLQDSSLLLDSDDMEWFRMHDVIVDVAISLHDEFMDMKWSALVGRKDYGFREWSKDELRKCTAISFSHDGIDGLPEKLDCPNLRMLLLFGYNRSLKIHDSFFDHTKKLQVLVINGLSFTHLPSSIEFIENLKSLCLDNCNLEDVTVLAKLKGLQFLSLKSSMIERLPEEIGKLTELRFLDLTSCFQLIVIDPGVLGRLDKLEELYIDKFDRWEIENKASQSNASLAELKNMKKLRTLYITIPHSAKLSSDLPFGNLNKYKIQIGGIRGWMGGSKESNILKLKLDSVNLLHEVWMQRCLQLTHDLHLDGLQEGEASIHRLCNKGFQELKHLHVQNNPSFKYIVDTSQCPAFVKLESLSLKNLNKLEKICHGVLAAESFSKLKIVKMENCGEIKHSFPSSVMRIFLQLEAIEISKCHLMQQIVANAEADEDGDEIDDEPNVKSCMLRRLTLQNLPKLMSFCKTMDHGVAFFNNEQVSLRWLESLTLSKLPKLKVIWNSQFPSYVDNLKFLVVQDCMFLLSIFPSNFVTKLQNLEAITVERCPLIREVFDLKGLTVSEDDEILSQLTTLILSDLPRLGYIWSNHPRIALCLRNLRRLTVQKCDNLRFLFSSSMIRALQQIKQIKIGSCKLLEEIIDVQEEESGEALMEHVAVNTKERQKRLAFLDLKELELWDLPRLNAFVTSSAQATLSLPSLTTVSLHNCHSLRYLFTNETSKTLDKLQRLEVSGCNNLQEVVATEESDKQKLKAVEFSHLRTLKLCSLKSLISFSLGSGAYEFPSLRSLSILECTKLKAFILRPPASRVETTNKESASFDESPHSLFDEKVLFPSLESLTLVSCGLMKIWHNELSEESFCKLAFITIRDCENLSHIFPLTLIEVFRSLERIEVVNCTSLESVMEHVAVDTKKRPKSLVFLDLKEVNLWDLPRLKALVTCSSQATSTLLSLTNVSLRNCDSLRYLFTYDTFRTLDKLEMLDVSNCNKMQEIVAIEENEEQKLKAVKFSHLCTLKLYSLKSLISFSSGSCAYEFPSLRNLSILKCTELKAFILWLPAPRVETMNEGSSGSDESLHSLFNKKVVFPNLEELHVTAIQSRVLWENEMPNESICKLKVLEVKQCPNLLNVIPSFMWKRLLQSMTSLIVEECPCVRNLFTMSMAKSLVQLKYLGLGGCGEMEYIVAREEEKLEEAPDIIVIPQLVTLYLHKMIKLRSFCHGKHISEWPSLKEFTIEDCTAVEVILGDADCRRLQDSIPTQQPLLLVEKVEFPSMESMKISHMDNVKKIWLDELPSNAFTKLKKLIVEYCEKLSSIFSSDSILTRFQNLEKLKVTDCDSLEVVFQMQELNISGSHSTSTFQLRKLKLKRLQKMKHVWSGPPCGTLTFEQLCCLKAKNCDSLKSLFPVSIAKSMTQLEELLVQDCGVEEIIAVEGGVGMSAGDLFFPQLTDLRLLELPELRRFYRNSHALTWPHLNILRVRHCGKMRLFSVGTTTGQNQPTLLFPFEEVIPNLEELTLMSEDVMMMMQQHHVFRGLTELELACYHDGNVAFPSDFLLHRFPDLEELSLSCSSLEEIFPEGACGHGGATPYGELTDMETPLMALKNLRRLELNKLCKLQRVWKDGSLMTEILKQIGTLHVSKCSSLSIVLPSPTAFQRLAELEVKDCAGLVHMGTCSAVTSLVHLTWLTLRNCGAMEDVVTDDGNGVEEISFPKLWWLTLDGLPSLESFSSVNCTFMFPSLERITVKQCPKMNIFCNGALSTPRVRKVFLLDEDYKGRWEGDLNATIQFSST